MERPAYYANGPYAITRQIGDGKWISGIYALQSDPLLSEIVIARFNPDGIPSSEYELPIEQTTGWVFRVVREDKFIRCQTYNKGVLISDIPSSAFV
jgi:hypothetical protein